MRHWPIANRETRPLIAAALIRRLGRDPRLTLTEPLLLPLLVRKYHQGLCLDEERRERRDLVARKRRPGGRGGSVSISASAIAGAAGAVLGSARFAR